MMSQLLQVPLCMTPDPLKTLVGVAKENIPEKLTNSVQFNGIIFKSIMAIFQEALKPPKYNPLNCFQNWPNMT